MVAIFLIVDAHLSTLPPIISWIFFLPILLVRKVAVSFGLLIDHTVLVQTMVGFPLQIVYLFLIPRGYEWIRRQMRRLVN